MMRDRVTVEGIYQAFLHDPHYTPVREDLALLCNLALRATEPDMVMVPRETMQALHNHVLDAHNGAVEALNVFYDLERTRVFIPESQEDQT